MRNRILTISHSTKILKHPVDNVKQKKYFFTKPQIPARRPAVPDPKSALWLPAAVRILRTTTIPNPEKTDSNSNPIHCFRPSISINKKRNLNPQQKFFFTFAARSAAQTTLPSLPKLPATAIFPFPIRHPLAPFFAFPRFSVPAPISVPFPQNLSTTPLFPAFPFLSSFQVPFPKLIPNPVQSLSPSSSPLPLSQPRDIFIFFLLLLFFFFFLPTGPFLKKSIKTPVPVLAEKSDFPEPFGSFCLPSPATKP